MKKMKKVLFVLVIVLTCGTYGSNAQIFVNVRPVRPAAVVRVEAPSPRHVWIDEDWRWAGGRYVWAGGRWEVPPHPGWRYYPGRWDHGPRGDRWISGHWGR